MDLIVLNTETKRKVINPNSIASVEIKESSDIFDYDDLTTDKKWNILIRYSGGTSEKLIYTDESEANSDFDYIAKCMEKLDKK